MPRVPSRKLLILAPGRLALPARRGQGLAPPGVVETFTSGRLQPARPAAAGASHHLSPHVVVLLRCIRQRASEPLTLSQFAHALGRQAEYLGWLFRHETGTTFHERLTTMRLRRAAWLIRRGERIERVAWLVGYRSKKNFYAQFQRRFGMTPGEYRHRIREGHRASWQPGRAWLRRAREQ
jgi:transcriptional regulator GlxA family with amidase domain